MKTTQGQATAEEAAQQATAPEMKKPAGGARSPVVEAWVEMACPGAPHMAQPSAVALAALVAETVQALEVLTQALVVALVLAAMAVAT